RVGKLCMKYRSINIYLADAIKSIGKFAQYLHQEFSVIIRTVYFSYLSEISKTVRNAMEISKTCNYNRIEPVALLDGIAYIGDRILCCLQFFLYLRNASSLRKCRCYSHCKE